MQQVEGKKRQPAGRAGGDGILQGGKAGGAVWHRTDDLAVDQRRIDRKPGERLRQLRKFGGPVKAAAGDQPDLAAARSARAGGSRHI